MEQPHDKVRVLIVDDHYIVRQTMRCILANHPNIEVVGEASDGDEAIAYTGRFQPSVVVMDMNMKKMDGITAARLIRAQYPHVIVLGFSADPQNYNVYAMQQAGAVEVLHKEDVMKNLCGVIERRVAAIQPHQGCP